MRFTAAIVVLAVLGGGCAPRLITVAEADVSHPHVFPAATPDIGQRVPLGVKCPHCSRELTWKYGYVNGAIPPTIWGECEEHHLAALLAPSVGWEAADKWIERQGE